MSQGHDVCYSVMSIARSLRLFQLNGQRIGSVKNEVCHEIKFWLVIDERFRGRNLNKGDRIVTPVSRVLGHHPR